MRHLFIALVLVLTAVRPGVAADRQWVAGKWAAVPDARTYRIETTAYRIYLEDLEPGERRTLDVVAGAAVRFAVEGDKVYVLERAGAERTLKLLRRVNLVYDALGGGHLIKSVGANGASITLEDGSVWQLDPINHFTTVEWQPMEGITVRPTAPEDGFSYTVDNTDRDQGTRARFTPPE